MKIELLVFPGCPNADLARKALREALHLEQLDVPIDEVDLGAADAPAALRAWGSPTILIDGADVTGASPAEGELCCRLYRGGTPAVDDIRTALLRSRQAVGGGATAGLPVLGALFAALAASACCIVPAALAVVGISGAGIAATLAPLRPYLLVATGLSLGSGLYLAYRRSRSCGDACGCAAPRTRRLARLALWLGVALTAGIATYPSLIDGHATVSGETAPGVAELRFHVDGMDCRACASSLAQRLARVPGVVSARVDYDAQLAVVTRSAARDPTGDILRTMAELGYRGSPSTEGARSHRK